MSYTSSDPENINRDFDSSSVASASTTSSQQSKTKKKPWSKFKSSIKSIGDKMSSRPKFSEQTESSEQKRVKKNKKFKGGNGEDAKPSSSTEESPKEKLPPKGPKSFIKKLSVENVSTPFVGYQPESISPTKSYAKAVHMSGSTSESNLSTSDLDSPKKSLTLDKNTKYSLSEQGSPDSGRPPSQIAEEGYGSSTQKDTTSDVSVDSDYTSPKRQMETTTLDLVAKTRHFADSLVVPKPEKTQKEKNVDVSEEFIKAETRVKNPDVPINPAVTSLDAHKSVKPKEKLESIAHDGQKDEAQKSNVAEASVAAMSDHKRKESSGKDEIDGRKKRGSKDSTYSKTDSKSVDLIKTEQDKSTKDTLRRNEEKNNIKETATLSTDKSSKTPKGNDDTPFSGTQLKKKEVSTSNVQLASSTLNDTKNTNPVISTPESKASKAKENTKVPESKISDEKENTEPEKNETLTLDEKNKTEPSKKVDTVTESSTTPIDTNVPSSDVGPLARPSSQDPSMTVEEKLAAFLSAEGWQDTIKDVAVKSADNGSQQPDKRECLYKVLVIGELGTGKTSIIKRYVHQFFSQHYRATIGVDFALKVLNWDPNTIIRLQLWDIAGQERFGNMTRVYYKEAVGAFIVFDVTRAATFDAVLKWKQDLDSKVQLADGSPIPCVLLANKCDQQKEGLVNTPAKMDEYCKENNFSAWFETSAKENINIDEAAKSLVSQILQNDKMSQNGRDSAKDGSKFPLDGKSEKESSSCSC